MTSENHHDFSPPAGRQGGGRVLLAGVAGACVLGVGLGLWARPSMSERQTVVRLAAAPAAAMRQLRIVVAEGPAPLGAPIEVLSKAPVPAADIVAPPAAPQGLVRVDAVSPPPAEPAPTPVVKKVAPQPPARRGPPRLQVAKARPAAPSVRLATAPRAKSVRKAEVARAAPVKAAPHKLELAHAQARAAKAARPGRLRLARAEDRGRSAAKAKAPIHAHAAARARAQLAKLARPALRAAPAKAKSHLSPTQLAHLDRKARPRRAPPVQEVTVKARNAPRTTAPAYRRPPAPMAPQPRPDGLMKVSTTPRCGGAHPCVDPTLGAAERQLARAYQGARDAGVPDAELKQRRQRWLAVRSASAREASWAVHDRYLARIAELNGMARDARRGGY